MADRQGQQDTQQQAAPETAGGQAVSTGGQLTTTEATARELAPAEADTKELSPGEQAERDIFYDVDGIKKKRFLRHYINTGGHIEKSAKFTGMSKMSHYVWLRDDEKYREAFEQAKEIALNTLENEAIRRGKHGYKEPVFYQGRKVGFVRRYSDNLLMFRMKRLDPAYRDNWTQQVGIMAGGRVQINFGIPRPDAEELEKGNK